MTTIKIFLTLVETVARLGISIEPMDQILQLQANLASSNTKNINHAEMSGSLAVKFLESNSVSN
jgi:hypothetical protein